MSQFFLLSRCLLLLAIGAALTSSLRGDAADPSSVNNAAAGYVTYDQFGAVGDGVTDEVDPVG